MRKREKKEKGSFASFYRVIQSAVTVDRLFFFFFFFFRVYLSAYFHVFNAVMRNFRPFFRTPSTLRPLPSIRHTVSLLALSPCRQRVARASVEAFAARDRGCAIATAVGKPGEPDQLQYRDTQTYWRNSRNLREAFGIPRWRIYPHSGLT